MFQFMSDLKQSLPARLNFKEFSAIVGSLCMNASQLRIKISKTEESRIGCVVVKSQASTIVLSYLNKSEQIQSGQLVCKKWYQKFVPQVIITFFLNVPIQTDRSFRLRYCDPETNKKLYLGAFKETSEDQHDQSIFVHAGSSKNHRNFRWKMNAQNELLTPNNFKLSARRYYGRSIIGHKETYVMANPGHFHSGIWDLERIRAGDQRSYTIVFRKFKNRDNLS